MEEERTIDASIVLQNGDIAKFGELMYASPRGYQISMMLAVRARFFS